MENEVGTFRRNRGRPTHWVPLPVARDLADLNAQLLAAGRAHQGRVLAGRGQPVGAALALERPSLQPLVAEPFNLAETTPAVVTTLGTVVVRPNRYSVPLAAGTTVEVRVLPSVVEVWHGGQCVATHPRSYGRSADVLDREHSLDVLVHKPGALAGSKPLDQAPHTGHWPASYHQLWAALRERQRAQLGTRALIELLQLGRQHGHHRRRTALEQAFARGCPDVAAPTWPPCATCWPRPTSPARHDPRCR